MTEPLDAPVSLSLQWKASFFLLPKKVQSGPTNYSDMHYNENLSAPFQHANRSLKLPFVWYGGWLEFVSWIVKLQLKIKQKG